MGTLAIHPRRPPIVAALTPEKPITMPTTLTASEQPLKKVFSDDYRFIVPEYQRPYSWTTEQVSVLLDDLSAAVQRDDKSPYFLGSVVIIKNESSDSYVVDGQQRLATLTMLLCVLRDTANRSDTKARLHKYVGQEEDPIAGTQEDYRLSLRNRDKAFFRDRVQRPESTQKFIDQDCSRESDTRKLIATNIAWLTKNIRSFDDRRRERLAAFIVQLCYLVVVSASDEDSAYRIFSVMNDRGLDLSPTDILKAKIVGETPKHLRTQYADEWELIESDLGREDFKELFVHVRMIFAQKKSHGTLQREFKENVLDETGLKGADVIERIVRPYSELYSRVSRPSYTSDSTSSKINIYLGHLGRLDNADWIPSAMNAFDKLSKASDQLLFIQNLERLAYAMFVLRMNINDRINRYAKVLSLTHAGDMLGDSPLQLSEGEKRRVKEVLNGPIYELTRVRRPLLLRLDSLLGDEDVQYNYPIITVEHVLPQNPHVDSEWMRAFPNDQDRTAWTHRLANLVLLSRRRNSRASNYEFLRKKDEYFSHDGTTGFALTSQVTAHTHWTAEVLEQRQRTLITTLSSAWGLE